ncbi:MAG TPA: 4-alpha-glucanotransferase [Pseudolabrys sp.]|nr:4-alpha-glucanotransferase [Pseudolabrys sp.]
MNDLTATAQAWGVESGYFDVFGKRYAASEDTLRRLIAVVSAGRDHPSALAPIAEPAMRCWQGDGRRLWLLAAQLYGLRSRRNWGIGDFTDLTALVARAAAHGAAGVGLNPLHALFPEDAGRASPYAPNSRLFLNLLYIDVEAIPEFPGLAEAGLADEVARLRETELVSYVDVAAAKLSGLHLAYDAFRAGAGAERRADFEAYREEQGDALLRFACFEVLRRRHAPAQWTEWPAPWRNPDIADLHDFRFKHHDEVAFEEFVQWVADRQLAACQDTAHRLGMPVGLYLDLAVGIDRHGADAWINHGAVLNGVSMGAPPDEFNPQGQDWGLAPLNPHAVPDDDFRTLRLLMRAAMRHAGAIRLDHVLGLQRVFMIPLGRTAADGAYVRFPFHQLLSVIAEESVRERCIVIGEDLGTVPENFRATIDRWGLWCYRVMLFEREGDDAHFKPPEAYPESALATFNTHDMASFRGWTEGHDMVVKRSIGFDPGENDDARNWARQKLRDILSARARDYPPDDLAAVAEFLGLTRARLVAISLDDVVGEREQVNIPGTTDQHPNWRRKLPLSIEELEGHETLRRVGEAFAKAGRAIR